MTTMMKEIMNPVTRSSVMSERTRESSLIEMMKRQPQQVAIVDVVDEPDESCSDTQASTSHIIQPTLEGQRKLERIMSYKTTTSNSRAQRHLYSPLPTPRFTRIVAITVQLFLLVTIQVHAYPTGAGSCPSGIAAVNGTHLNIENNKVILGGRLVDHDIIVTIDNDNDSDTTILVPYNRTTTTATLNPSLYVKTPYTISVSSTQSTYTGVLIRMEVPFTGSSFSNNVTLLPLTNTQVSFPCLLLDSNIMGITHFNNTFKQVHSGIMEVDQTIENVILDITVVMVNNANVSVYGYDRFLLNFIDPTVPSTPSSTSSSTIAPTPIASPVVAVLPTTTIPPPTSYKVRKNVNVTTASVSESDTKFTFVAENVQVQLSYILSSILTDGEIRAYERIIRQWYMDFYNTNFATKYNTTTNHTDIIILPIENENDSKTNGTNRQLQKDKSSTNQLSLSNNYGIVLGSMSTTINVTNVTYIPYSNTNVKDSNDKNSSTATKNNKTTVQITYSQSIIYQSTTNRTKPQQYITIPYRSGIGRQLYIQALVESNIYTFSELSYNDDTNLSSTLSVPLLIGPPVEAVRPDTETSSNGKDDSFPNGYIVLITVGGLAFIAFVIYLYQSNKYRFLPTHKATTDGDDDGVMASMLAQQQNDAETFRLHSSATSTGGGTGLTNTTNGTFGHTEYIIYAPAGRLGIVLDDPNVLSHTTNKDREHGDDDNDTIQYGPVISMIKEGSPLINEANMNVGDMIVAIDDIDVRNMTPQRVSKLINDRSKHPIRKITCVKMQQNRIHHIHVPE
jgi:PDZ domain